MRGVRTASLCVLALLVQLAGCGGRNETTKGSTAEQQLEAVFIGSSQLLGWHLSESFPSRKFVNKGVSGDTSNLMLARFQSDVVAAKPKVVVIWAGENDVEHALPLDEIKANVQKMNEAAAQNNIRVVLCTLAPKAGKSASQNPIIVELNAWLRDFALTNSATKPIVIADIYAVVVDSSGNLRSDMASGNEHLSQAAYAALTPMMSAAVDKAQQ